MLHDFNRFIHSGLFILIFYLAHSISPSGGVMAQPEPAFGIDQANVLEIVARHPAHGDDQAHYEFVLSAEEIPAGWTTIKLRNQSSSTHFGYIVRVPDEQAGLSREEYMDAVSLPFQDAWDPYFSGEIDVGGFFDLLLPALPDWSALNVASSGPGFTSGHTTSRMSVYLEPGTYFIECYMMDTEGVFHTTHGMVEKLVVTESHHVSEEPPVQPDVNVTISSAGGIAVDAESMQPGPTTFEVIFEDNILYGHGLGHDVHLIRLEDGTTVEEVNDWMNYLDIGADGFYADRGALVSASGQRGPQQFLGGVQSLFPIEEMGQDFPLSAYFHVDLTPGQYALVAEVPNPMQPDAENPGLSMLQEFSVTPWASVSGAWMDPKTDGQGWSFYATPQGFVGTFFGYSDNGENLWLATENLVDDLQLGEPVTFDLLYGADGSFGSPVNPENMDFWGQATITFESCNEATAEISGVDGTESHNLQRIVGLIGVPECTL
jgi:hypothetical protein